MLTLEAECVRIARSSSDSLLGKTPSTIYCLSSPHAPIMPKSPKNAESAFEQTYNAYFERGKPSIRALAKGVGLTSQADL